MSDDRTVLTIKLGDDPGSYAALTTVADGVPPDLFLDLPPDVKAQLQMLDNVLLDRYRASAKEWPGTAADEDTHTWKVARDLTVLGRAMAEVGVDLLRGTSFIQAAFRWPLVSVDPETSAVLLQVVPALGRC